MPGPGRSGTATARAGDKRPAARAAKDHVRRTSSNTAQLITTRQPVWASAAKTRRHAQSLPGIRKQPWLSWNPRTHVNRVASARVWTTRTQRGGNPVNQQPPPGQSPVGQPAHASPSSSPRGGPAPQRRWPRRAAIAGAVIVALLAGVSIGSTASNNAGALNLAHRNLNTADRNLAATRVQASTLRAEYSAAKTQARQATGTADARAKAAYASRNEALDARSRSLTRRARAVSTAEGQVQSSTISSDGVYVVGKDIQSGTYHTSGDDGQTDNECYYATLNSSNTSDISDNNNFDGPETVDVSGAYAFQISGPCTWIRES
jgi:hypothetical protein